MAWKPLLCVGNDIPCVFRDSITLLENYIGVCTACKQSKTCVCMMCDVRTSRTALYFGMDETKRSCLTCTICTPSVLFSHGRTLITCSDGHFFCMHAFKVLRVKRVRKREKKNYNTTLVQGRLSKKKQRCPSVDRRTTIMSAPNVD